MDWNGDGKRDLTDLVIETTVLNNAKTENDEIYGGKWESPKSNDAPTWLVIVLSIILFILAPLVCIISSLVFLPWSLKIAFLLLLVATTLSFIFIKNTTAHWTVSIICCVLYALLTAVWYATAILDGDFSGGGLGDTIGVALIAFSMIVPAWLMSLIFTVKRKK